MNVQEQIKKYIASQPEAKRSDMLALHKHILTVLPTCKLWFLDGKNDQVKLFLTLILDTDLTPLNMLMEQAGSFIRLV